MSAQSLVQTPETAPARVKGVVLKLELVLELLRTHHPAYFRKPVPVSISKLTFMFPGLHKLIPDFPCLSNADTYQFPIDRPCSPQLITLPRSRCHSFSSDSLSSPNTWLGPACLIYHLWSCQRVWSLPGPCHGRCYIFFQG